jgi:hypothetical protein
VVTNVLPNKGLPLPFISRGGSNLVVMLVSVGLLVSIARRAVKSEAAEPALTDMEELPEAADHVMSAQGTRPWVAVACGGTGGHLFPGIAVGEVLAAHGCAVTLMVSSKEIDRRGASLAPQFECITLPAVGLERGRSLEFFAVVGSPMRR